MTFGAPRAARAALQRVFERHPYTADGEVHASARVDEDAARLWERLLVHVGDEEALAGGVRALSRPAERLLVYGAGARLDHPGAMKVLATLYALRPPDGERALSLAWELWLTTDGADAFHPAATRYALRHPERTMWTELARQGAAPLARAATLVEREHTPLERWAATPAVALADRARVMRAFRRVLLRPGRVRATVAREGGAATVRWMSQVLNEEERTASLAAYLDATWRGEWRVDDVLLLAVLQRYGEPARGGAFWNDVAPGVVAAVESWIKLVELTRLLGEGEHGDRVSFWRKFLPEIRRFASSRDESAVLICFDRLFAVQFIEPGVATYLFPQSFLTGFQRLVAQRLAARVREMARIGENLGKYEQRGFVENWQATAEWVVRDVMRRMEDRP